MRRRIFTGVLIGALGFAMLAKPNGTFKAAAQSSANQVPATKRFRLNPDESKFIAHALSGGLLWFKGHDHLIAAREFSGAQIKRTDKSRFVQLT